MAENMVVTENGNIKISPEVIMRISAIAAREIEGVAGLGPAIAIGDLLGKKAPSKGVKVEVTEESTVIDVHVTVKFGIKINEIAPEIQKVVKNAVEEYAEQAELITLIPGDSIPSEGYYSELRDLFNSSEDNEYNFSLKPSVAMQNLSASQYYCHVETNSQGEKDTIYAPKNVTWESSKVDMSGDLRLYYAWDLLDGRNKNGDKIEEQSISKHNTRNVHIYRRTMLYLRMAEALNRAGYPVMAYKFLASGVNNKVIEDEVIPCYAEDPAKVAFLRQFDFPTDLYGILNPGVTASETANTIGIHSRGSGWGSASAYYQMPDTASLSLDEQIEAVEDMIVNEAALEFAFEGTRFYDLMRVALRRSDVNYLADRVAMRTGVNNEALRVKLQTQANWYLDWNGEIGIDKE